MEYKISYKDPHKHFIEVELKIDNIFSNHTYIQVSGWRPGRYELQNYARNIQKIEIIDERGNCVSFKKITRNKWVVDTANAKSIIVKYNVYCNQLDAGGALLDEDQLYLNLIYCLLNAEGREEEACKIVLDIPDNYKIGCGLPKDGKELYSSNYFHAADSPLIASPNLIEKKYEVEGIAFNISIKGDVKTDWDKVLSDFAKFTKESINLFGGFPANDYHFLYEIPHHKFHHGVEHSNSTIIVLGPAESFNTPSFYENFLGISCHELFHAWNALKIRPKEMMPYDLSQENYFRTGFVIEGITTYYGDYLLARCGAITTEQYFKEVNSLFQKHFESFGRFNLSLADSSFDLWIDGYVPGIPNRKVSIYHKGAVIAMILDLEIRKITHNKKCLDDVMKHLWLEFGKKGIGYSEEDYQKVVELIAGQSMDDYFSHCVYGLDPTEERLNEALEYIGCNLVISDSPCSHERVLGFKTSKKDGRLIIDAIEPGSPADKVLTIDDELIAINNEKIENNLDQLIGSETKITLLIIRSGKLLSKEIEGDGKSYLNRFSIKKREDVNEEAKENFKNWLKAEF